jgi:pyruvate dehydrogenase complex dehydrogenase (E1) component
MNLPAACDGELYFQGHAAPGIYARAFLEGRISKKHLENFRQELETTFRGAGWNIIKVIRPLNK